MESTENKELEVTQETEEQKKALEAEKAKAEEEAKELQKEFNSLDALKKRVEDVRKIPAPVHDPENVIEVSHLVKYFPIKIGLFSKLGGYVRAVDDVSFNIKRGTTMGLVGESGCGKTTVGKTLLRLNDKTAGHVMFNGVDIHELPEK